jgi:hypothetical protein
MPITLKSTGGGSITLTTPSTASDYTLTFPAQNGTPITTLPGTSGNVLTSDGTNWTSAASSGTATAEIITSTASSKSGYLLCDGSLYSRSSYTALAAAIGTPLMPKNTLGAALTGYIGTYIQEANGLLLRSGSASSGGGTNAVNTANAITTSTDGITWTLRTGVNMSSSNNNQYLAYGNSKYVALTAYYNYQYVQTQDSSDGVTWTQRANNTLARGDATEVWGDIAFGGTSNRFVRGRTYRSYNGGCDVNSGTMLLEYSSDGITWTTGQSLATTSGSFTFPAGGYVAGYSGGFVATASTTVSGGTNYVYYSADGATWTDITSNINSVATINGGIGYPSYVNGRFILSTGVGQIYTSTTGASGSWSLLTSNNSVLTGARVRGNANGYATNLNGTSYYSTDLLTWVAPTNLGLGTITVTATPSTGTRFYGTGGTSGSYYIDLYNYTTATQFPVPAVYTTSTSSPNSGNNIPVNYFIKT